MQTAVLRMPCWNWWGANMNDRQAHMHDEVVMPAGRVAGVDEAGRGPLAGPVVAGAVILDAEKPIDGLKDSKCLSASRREVLFGEIQEKALAWSVAYASVEEIDSINILQATLLAMQRAVDALRCRRWIKCIRVTGWRNTRVTRARHISRRCKSWV